MGEGGVPGGEDAWDFVGAALGGGVEGAALGAEDVHVEFGEGSLGEVLEVDVDLAGLGSGVTVPGNLTWTPKPLKARIMRKRLPGFGSPR